MRGSGEYKGEAPGGFEPPIRVLQTRALPLGYGAARVMFQTRFKTPDRSNRTEIVP